MFAHNTAKVFALKINLKKIEVMYPLSHDIGQSIQIQGQVLTQVKFKYLGSTVNNRLDVELDTQMSNALMD